MLIIVRGSSGDDGYKGDKNAQIGELHFLEWRVEVAEVAFSSFAGGCRFI